MELLFYQIDVNLLEEKGSLDLIFTDMNYGINLTPERYCWGLLMDTNSQCNGKRSGNSLTEKKKLAHLSMKHKIVQYLTTIMTISLPKRGFFDLFCSLFTQSVLFLLALASSSSRSWKIIKILTLLLLHWNMTMAVEC